MRVCAFGGRKCARGRRAGGPQSAHPPGPHLSIEERVKRALELLPAAVLHRIGLRSRVNARSAVCPRNRPWARSPRVPAHGGCSRARRSTARGVPADNECDREKARWWGRVRCNRSKAGTTPQRMCGDSRTRKRREPGALVRLARVAPASATRRAAPSRWTAFSLTRPLGDPTSAAPDGLRGRRVAEAMEMPAPPAGDVRLPKNAIEKSAGRRVIVVLEQASLETVKTKKVRRRSCDCRHVVRRGARQHTHTRKRNAVLPPSRSCTAHATRCDAALLAPAPRRAPCRATSC